MLAVNVLLRRRWIEEERLSFPLVQVPLAVIGATHAREGLFRNRLFQLSFGLSIAVGLLNGLRTFFPSLPSLQLDLYPINALLYGRWEVLDAMGGVVWPPLGWAIGVGFLMPLDISFSYWFFYLFMKIEHVLTMVWGWDVAPEAPFPYSQSAGALLTLGIITLWSARRYLRLVVLQALRSGNQSCDGAEPMRYRWALLLLICSAIGMGLFVWAADAPLWLIPVLVGLHLTATLAMTRLRAELGAPASEVHHISPAHILTHLVSPAAFPLRALSVLTIFGWSWRSLGTDPTPFQMEGLKLARGVRLNTRSLTWAMVLAVVFGLIAGYIALLMPLYHLGMDSSKLTYDTQHASAAFSELHSWSTSTPRGAGYHGLAMGASVLLTSSLLFLRSRFLWWPLHPLGYVLAPMWFTHHLWLSIWLAWLVKLILLRYGGMRSYTKALPFFLGLILGDCVIGGFWAILAPVFHFKTFSVWM
jgi:hypothetical protein